jgi:hypothetical protein
MQNQQQGHNMIDVIEERLKQLEREKEEIENEYGINEDILQEYTKKPIKIEKIKPVNYNNLPKLEIRKKETIKNNYKTPDTLVDSLKYEPDINDLLDPDEFESKYTNIHNIKSNPSIPKEYNTKEYINFLLEEYNNNYLN